jgi:DNA (cytosine-5)-methyltransferase 1
MKVALSAPTMKIRAIDLFCGAGGSSWGAKAAGVEIVAGFDHWGLAGQVYQDNFPGVRLFDSRLEEIDVGVVAQELGHIDLILASPECTNHSPAKGNKPRSEESKNTAFQVTRFADVFKPRWIVVENVVSMRRWSRYEKFKAGLEQLGYHVTEQVLNATHFGVPQSRRRLFLLCDRECKPVPTPKPEIKHTLQARQFVNLNGAYRWTPLVTERRAKATLERAERAKAIVGERRPFLLVYYGSDRSGGWQRISAPLRTITTLDRFAIVKRKNGVYIMRMLQVPELQEAMGLHSMQFNHGSRRDRIKMIGNAVCPPVMKHVVKTLTAHSLQKM